MEQNTGLTVALILGAIAVLMQAGTMLGIWLANHLEPPCTHGGVAFLLPTSIMGESPSSSLPLDPLRVSIPSRE